MTNRKLFVSLPVRDLQRSVEFFSKLGFEFNPQFSGDHAACMLIGVDAFVMLGTVPFFKTLDTRELCDASTHTEALFTVSCDSRDEVDKLVKLAVDNGGKAAGVPQDHGFMYDWSFYDLDGHGWGVMWMDPNSEQK
jgi:predicted lactoylglutathione lyase